MDTLRGSIFGKRIEIIQPAECIFDTVCVCPHCGKHVTYGNMMMVSGVSCCPLCYDDLCITMEHDKAVDYSKYANADYEPYGIVENSYGTC